MMNSSIFVFGLLACLGAAGPLLAQTTNRGVPEGTRVVKEIAYVPGGDVRQRLDLYVPAGGASPKPLVIWIHGGAFMFGNKGDRSRAWKLLEQDYAVASLDYRKTDTARFPEPVEDCKAAVRWLRANAREYGIDPNRFGAVGESAGGYLVAMLGTTGDCTDFDRGPNEGVSSAVQCVADFYGPTDFTLMNRQGEKIPGHVDHDEPDSPESKLLGGPVQENKEKAAKANPITYVSPSDPPFLIVHGDLDPLVPYGQSEILEAALKKAGVPVRLHTVNGAGHGDGFGKAEQEAMETFFKTHLKPGS